MTRESAILAAAVFTIVALVSASMAGVARMVALHAGVMDHPGRRKAHAAPTPRLGGIAVFFSFTLAVGIGYPLAPWFTALPIVRAALPVSSFVLRDAHKVQGKLLALLTGATLVFAIGLADDVWRERFPPWAKALGQIAAAGVLIQAGVTTSFLPQAWMNTVLTLVWLVGMTNAFNLLDNMDALSAGVAFVALIVLLINAWTLEEIFISLILVAFMGSLLGFLVFNVHPARLFLGDCGSLFIGYVMGSLTLLEKYVSNASGLLFPVLMPVLVLAVPLVDTATVVFIRLRERRPIYVGDDRHLSHRLVALGFSRPRAVLVLHLLTLSLGLGAAALTDANLLQSVLVLLQTAGFIAVVLMLMFSARPAPPAAGPPA
ncbi:MAG TPA: MraY family glycosyltransferase [Vicinamibacteria bacterium]|nr:MraY family glycosyltransferase [Vicinamibacteria bacterium]